MESGGIVVSMVPECSMVRDKRGYGILPLT